MVWRCKAALELPVPSPDSSRCVLYSTEWYVIQGDSVMMSRRSKSPCLPRLGGPGGATLPAGARAVLRAQLAGPKTWIAGQGKFKVKKLKSSMTEIQGTGRVANPPIENVTARCLEITVDFGSVTDSLQAATTRNPLLITVRGYQ